MGWGFCASKIMLPHSNDSVNKITTKHNYKYIEYQLYQLLYNRHYFINLYT